MRRNTGGTVTITRRADRTSNSHKLKIYQSDSQWQREDRKLILKIKNYQLSFFRKLVCTNYIFVHLLRGNPYFFYKILNRRKFVGKPREGVVHRNDHFWLNTIYHLHSLFGPNRINSANRNKQNINFANLPQVFLGQPMSQISKMAKAHRIHTYGVNRIPTSFTSPRSIVKAAYPKNRNLTNLVLPRTQNFFEISPNPRKIVVILMVVRNSNNISLRLWQFQTSRSPVRISNYRCQFPFYPK